MVMTKEGVHNFDPLPEDNGKALSPREIEVLQHFAWGYYYKEIADHIGISYQTAKNHGPRIFRKLGAHNRPHAVAIGIARGYIAADTPDPYQDAEVIPEF